MCSNSVTACFTTFFARVHWVPFGNAVFVFAHTREKRKEESKTNRARAVDFAAGKDLISRAPAQKADEEATPPEKDRYSRSLPFLHEGSVVQLVPIPTLLYCLFLPSPFLCTFF